MKKAFTLKASMVLLTVAIVAAIATWLPKRAGTENNHESVSASSIQQKLRARPDFRSIQQVLERTSNPKDMTRLARTSDQRQELLAFYLDTQRFTLRPDHEIAALFREWFDADPEGALEEIKDLPDESLRRKCLLQGAEFFIKDFEKIFLTSNSVLESEIQRHLFLVETSGLIAELNPWLSLELVQNDEFDKYRRDAIKTIFQSVASMEGSQLQELLLLADRLPTEYRDTALKAALDTGRIRLDLRDYTLLQKSLSDESLLHNIFLSGVRKTLADGGATQLQSRLPKAGVPPGAKAGFAKLVLGHLERENPLSESVSKAFETGLFIRNHDEPAIARALSSEWSIKEAKSFLDSIPQEISTRPEVAEVVASRAVMEDSQQAAIWIAELPAGPTRDRALQPLLAYLLDLGEAEAHSEFSALLSKDAQ